MSDRIVINIAVFKSLQIQLIAFLPSFYKGSCRSHKTCEVGTTVTPFLQRGGQGNKI
jgi:hypothetical protein